MLAVRLWRARVARLQSLPQDIVGRPDSAGFSSHLGVGGELASAAHRKQGHVRIG